MTNGATPVIKVDRASRWFGSVVAVSDVTFSVSPGITGLLGPNGAGKTTLLRMMTGLVDPSDGTVTVFGEPVRRNPPLYGRMGMSNSRFIIRQARSPTAAVGRPTSTPIMIITPSSISFSRASSAASVSSVLP